MQDRSEQWPAGCWKVMLGNRRVHAFVCDNEARFVGTAAEQPLFSLSQRAPMTLIVSVPEGRFEVLGERKEIPPHLRCRIEQRDVPLSACVARFEWPGLLQDALGSLREHRAVR